MEWITPKTDWQADDALTPEPFNRIEGNILHLHENKVDRVANKGLSTNDYTTEEKNKLAEIEEGPTADMSADEILAALKTVDGTGSGLDADTLGGKDSTAFAPSDHEHSTYAKLIAGNYTGNDTAGRIINLGFRPSVVLITTKNDQTIYGCMDGNPTSNVEIVENGFKLGSGFLNRADQSPHHYIAFR